MSGIRYNRLEAAAGSNVMLRTNSGGLLVPISAPTTSGQVLTYSGGNIVWSTSGSDQYIGNSATHTAGGILNTSFNINSSAIIKSVTFSIDDRGGSTDNVPWLLQEDDTTNGVTFSHNSSVRFLLGTDGALTLGGYGAGTKTGTAAYILGVTASGNIVEVTSGGGSSTTIYNGDAIITANRIVHLTNSTTTPTTTRTLTFQGLNDDIIFNDGIISSKEFRFNNSSITNHMSFIEEEFTGTTQITIKKDLTSNIAAIKENGQWRFYQYDGSTFTTATLAGILTYDASGNVYDQAPSINLLSDVTITTGTLADGQFLRYDTGTSQWVNQDVNLYENFVVRNSSSAVSVGINDGAEVIFDVDRFIVTTPSVGNVQISTEPIVFSDIDATTANAHLGTTISLPTASIVGGSIYNIFTFSAQPIAFGVNVSSLTPAPEGAIIIPPQLGTFDIVSYGIAYNASASGNQVTTNLYINGTVVSGTTLAVTSAASGYADNALDLSGSPVALSARDVIQVSTASTGTGNPQGLVYYIIVKRN